MARSRLFIIDPGFVAPRGHHLSNTLMLQDACRDRGVPLTFFVANSLANYQEIKPVTKASKMHFEFPPGILYHAHRAALGDATVENFLLFGDRTAAVLADKVSPCLREGVVAACHSANATVVYALGKWLRSLSPDSVPPLVVNLGNHITPNPIHARLYRAAFRQLAPFPGVRLFGGTVGICRLIREYSGRDAKIFPMPYSAVATLETAREAPVFGLAGEAREDKNLSILPGAMEEYFSRGGTGSFSLQLHFHLGLNPGLAPLHDDLIRLADKYPGRIALNLNPLYGDDYYRHVAACNAMILPYPPEKYRNRLSQVISDACAAGVSVITTGGSSLEEDLAHCGNDSVVMRDPSGPALAEAFFAFERDWVQYRARAAAAGEAFRKYNNKKTYMDVLFDVDDAFPYPDFARSRAARRECIA